MQQHLLPVLETAFLKQRTDALNEQKLSEDHLPFWSEWSPGSSTFLELARAIAVTVGLAPGQFEHGDAVALLQLLMDLPGHWDYQVRRSRVPLY